MKLLQAAMGFGLFILAPIALILLLLVPKLSGIIVRIMCRPDSRLDDLNDNKPPTADRLTQGFAMLVALLLVVGFGWLLFYLADKFWFHGDVENPVVI